MDFVLVLHTHLPYVLGHGRWPHGSDWLMEATVDCYLPLIEAFDTLKRDGVRAPVTFSVTPVVAAQLAHPDFPAELRAFFAQRLAACDEAERDLAGDDRLRGIVRYWRNWHRDRAGYFEYLNAD